MRAAALMIPLLLAACTAADGQGPSTTPAAAEGPCRNDGLDRFAGQTASADIAHNCWKHPAPAPSAGAPPAWP